MIFDYMAKGYKVGLRADKAEFGALPIRPGKVIAVHLSYESRAKQRGHRPGFPSYFLKASSSISQSGEDIVRPPGTELLAFEGEIALVISKSSKNIPIQKAWDHVGWVTAANDFGLHDFKLSDKGSNVRSKSRDGYTPIGPKLLDSSLFGPENIRIRTWVNGTIVQDDTTAGLMFPLPQLVSDLSQHFTLEEGDVILTGTPFGSSVVNPGDVVEVEVDVPNAETSTTSGRLISRVIQGGEPEFSGQLGCLPSVNDLQREEAWGSRQLAGLPENSPTLSDQLRSKLESVQVAGLSAQLRKRGLNNVHIDGPAPMHRDKKLVGTARTLRFVPNREDLFEAYGTGYNAQKQVFDSVRRGEVIVIEARGESSSGTFGDILAIRANSLGASGIVTDGGVRDLEAVAAIGIQVYSLGGHPAVLGRKHVPLDQGITISCGGATVQPGDVIVGDSDGVIVIPRDIAEEIVDAALEQELEDEWVASQVAEGNSVDGLFPPSAEWKARYEAWRQNKES